MRPMIDPDTRPLRDKIVFWQAALGYLLKGKARWPRGHIPPGSTVVPEDFAAICVASMDDPACDSLMIDYLRQLGIEAVRLDYGYEGPGGHAERFLQQLLAHSFKVLLRLVPPPEEARQLHKDPALERWGDFVAKTLDGYGADIEAIEVGNTVNRRRWSGFITLDHFMRAWNLAHDLARARDIVIAGPNISDFEPPFNAGFLAVQAGYERLPDIQTDNLFVERAFEPEAFDRKIVGRWLGPLHKLNLVKKARLLERLGQEQGVARTWSTTSFWSLKRIGRRMAQREEKQADYIARYMLLAAASGGLKRVYWGPLVSQREGLVDDGTGQEARHELVTFYDANNGNTEDYRKRPAFDAFAAFNRLIPGATYKGKRGASQQLQIHEFESGEHRLHAAWTINTRAAEIAAVYSASDLAAAEISDRDGHRVEEPPTLITESPIYLRWPLAHPVSVPSGAEVLPHVFIDGNRPGGRHYLHRDERWLGLVFARDRQQADRLIAALHPDHLVGYDETNTLRKSRNVIWKLDDPRRPGEQLTAKKPHRLKLNKRINDHFKPPKGLRSWNGASQLVRYGIDSPLPVACFYRADRADILNNWYICEYAGDIPSVRDFFMAYAGGADKHLGVSRQQLFRELARFLLRFHGCGGYFRDLTGGNILVHMGPGDGFRFSLIDTGRVRFYPRGTPLYRRLSDLTRTCYKLDWARRREFMALYMEGLGKRFGLANSLPFRLFDLKMRLKGMLKGKKRPVRQKA